MKARGLTARDLTLSGSEARITQANALQRRTIAGLILLFFALIPFEGVLRKWVLNAVQQPLAFVRDPVLLGIYLLYAAWGDRRKVTWVAIWSAAAAIAVCLVAVEAALHPLPIALYAIGLRNYLLYIPLTFIMRDVITRDDVARYLRFSLMISVPIGVLVAVQFFSPVGSIINKGLDETIIGRFLVAAGVVRPYGPFTFAAAQATFSVLAMANLLVAYDRKQELGLPIWLWIAAAAASFTMGALSGARTYFIGAAGVFAFYFLGSITAPDLSKKAARTTTGLLVVAALLGTFVFVFPLAFQTMSSRQQAAEHAEGSTVARTLSMITTVGTAVDRAEPFGVGIGAGSNAGAFVRGETGAWTLGEYDWPRIVIETGPVFGLSYLAFRALFFALLFAAALRANRERSDSSALTMFGLAGPTLLVAQITGQNQMLSLCWFTCGLTLAMANPPNTMTARR